MRLLSKCIVLLPMLGACCTALSQASQQPTISLDTKNSTVKLGQPIQLHIVIRNTTNREFTIFRSVGGGRGEQYYAISVTDPDGKRAARTEYGEAVQSHQPVAGSKIMKTVKPGGTSDEYVLLNRMFDMHAQGTYSVQVSRANPLGSTILLESNTLVITVDDK